MICINPDQEASQVRPCCPRQKITDEVIVPAQTMPAASDIVCVIIYERFLTAENGDYVITENGELIKI